MKPSTAKTEPPPSTQLRKVVFGVSIFSGGFPVKMRHRVPLIGLVCATLLSSHPALAQFSQQGPKLVGTGAVGGALQGASVSLSADGNTAIVGGLGDNSNAGAAWVFAASAPAGSWVLSSSAFRGGLNGAEFHTDVRILN